MLTIKDDRKALELAKQAIKQNDLEVAKDMIIESLELNPYPSHAGRTLQGEDLREKYCVLFELFVSYAFADGNRGRTGTIRGAVWIEDEPEGIVGSTVATGLHGVAEVLGENLPIRDFKAVCFAFLPIAGDRGTGFVGFGTDYFNVRIGLRC